MVPTYSFSLRHINFMISCAINLQKSPSLIALLLVLLPSTLHHCQNVRPTAPSTTQWNSNWDPPPVSRKLQHGARTSVERSSTIQRPPPKLLAHCTAWSPQMAPDFRHPSTHPLFPLDQPCVVLFHIYLLFCNPFRDRRRRQSLSISCTLPHFCSLQLALNLCQQCLSLLLLFLLLLLPLLLLQAS
jgi:hypothetical protein